MTRANSHVAVRHGKPAVPSRCTAILVIGLRWLTNHASQLLGAVRVGNAGRLRRPGPYSRAGRFVAAACFCSKAAGRSA
jgi:hypothetical protein